VRLGCRVAGGGGMKLNARAKRLYHPVEGMKGTGKTAYVNIGILR